MANDTEELIAATMTVPCAWIIEGPAAQRFMKEMVAVLNSNAFKVFAGPAFDRPSARVVVAGFTIEDAAKRFGDYERSGRADHEIRVSRYSTVPALPSRQKRRA